MRALSHAASRWEVVGTPCTSALQPRSWRFFVSVCVADSSSLCTFADCKPDETSLESFARDDKWALGAGDGALFAPRFPLWLDAPGFWDEVTLHQYELAPLFTVTVLDEQGAEL